MNERNVSRVSDVSRVGWPEGGDVLDEIQATVHRYLVLTDEQEKMLAVWVVHTWTWEWSEYTPYVSLVSATMREGKTRVMEVMQTMVAKPTIAANMSTASLYRMIDEQHPTLFLDEVDADARMTQDFRRILNAGYHVDGTVTRSVNGRAYRFSVFCPKMFAGIGSTPPTVRDRSFEIRARRATPEELGTRERFRQYAAQEQAAPIRDALQELAARLESDADFGNALLRAEPQGPDLGNSRAVDIWEPLWAIADLVGGDWATAARDIAPTFVRSEGTPDAGVAVLLDIRAAFEESGMPTMRSEELVSRLNAMTSAHYSGRALTARSLADILRPFDIHPTQMRFGRTANTKGYRRDDFADAWARYTEPLP
jgi:hypothetical protein